MTQSQLARKIGTAERNITRWENEHAPRMASLSAIAVVTGKEIGFFLSDEDGSGEEEDEDLSDAEWALYGRLTARIHRVKAGA